MEVKYNYFNTHISKSITVTGAYYIEYYKFSVIKSSNNNLSKSISLL